MSTATDTPAPETGLHTDLSALEALLTFAVDDDTRAWTRQRLLRIGDTSGWYTYLGGNRSAHRFALRLPDSTVRVLHRDQRHIRQSTEYRTDEPMCWLLGQALARNLHDILDEVGPVPELFDVDRVADILELSPVSINVHVQIGKLNPLFIARRRRRFFADEIRAIVGDENDAAVWDTLRAKLPDTTRLEQIVYTETPAPDPLPVGYADEQQRLRHLTALRIAEDQGWLQFVSTSDNRYTLAFDGGQRLRVSGWAVLPFVWGVADAHGKGDLVAYR